MTIAYRISETRRAGDLRGWIGWGQTLMDPSYRLLLCQPPQWARLFSWQLTAILLFSGSQLDRSKVWALSKTGLLCCCHREFTSRCCHLCFWGLAIYPTPNGLKYLLVTRTAFWLSNGWLEQQVLSRVFEHLIKTWPSTPIGDKTDVRIFKYL